MKTQAYHYNEAIRELERGRELDEQAIRALIASRTSSEKRENWAHEWSHLAITATEEVKARGRYPYLDDVARVLADNLGMDVMDDLVFSTLKDVVYATNSYMRAKATIEKYERFWSEGFISIHDVEPEHHEKKAVLSGNSSFDFLTIKKDGEPVKIVCKGEMRGYKKPKMRTRFYRASVDADLFVKLT